MNELKAEKSKIVVQNCCYDHYRDWSETEGGLPARDHAPSCDNFKTERFFRIRIRGSGGPFFILENLSDVERLFKSEDYEISIVEMTRDQFERIESYFEDES